ncbi:MAG: DUF1801 domain-containing protein [Kineosporiaceae bacterium]
MDPAVERYVADIPAARRPLFDRVHALVLECVPDADVVISYGIPTYRHGSFRLYLGAWKHGVSLYGWGEGRDGGFGARHPELLSGRGTIKLTEAAAATIDDDDLRALIRASLS